jgi:hypothetical protein
VTIHQAYADGASETYYDRRFVYSEFGQKLTIKITGSTVFASAASVDSKEKRNVFPSSVCGEDDSTCFVAAHHTATFSDAEAYCQNKGGKLATTIPPFG